MKEKVVVSEPGFFPKDLLLKILNRKETAHESELCFELALSWGELQFLLAKLKKKGLIKKVRYRPGWWSLRKKV